MNILHNGKMHEVSLEETINRESGDVEEKSLNQDTIERLCKAVENTIASAKEQGYHGPECYEVSDTPDYLPALRLIIYQGQSLRKISREIDPEKLTKFVSYGIERVNAKSSGYKGMIVKHKLYEEFIKGEDDPIMKAGALDFINYGHESGVLKMEETSSHETMKVNDVEVPHIRPRYHFKLPIIIGEK